MKKNMATADRAIRIFLAVVIATLWAVHVISGTVAIVLLVIAGIFILTSLVGFCPMYAIFGMSTRPKKINQEKI